MLLQTAILALGLIAPLAAQSTATPTLSLFLLDVPSPAPTIQAEILSADASKTAYRLGCTAQSRGNSDPCSLIDGASITVQSDLFSLRVSKRTESISGSGLGTFTPEYFSTTTASVSCGITSNTASCTGGMTTTIVNRSQTSQGSTTISSVYRDVTGMAVPVTITSGANMATRTTDTETNTSSTGGAPKGTQQALLLAGAAMVAGGAAIL